MLMTCNLSQVHFPTRAHKWVSPSGLLCFLCIYGYRLCSWNTVLCRPGTDCWKLERLPERQAEKAGGRGCRQTGHLPSVYLCLSYLSITRLIFTRNCRGGGGTGKISCYKDKGSLWSWFDVSICCLIHVWYHWCVVFRLYFQWFYHYF